MYEREREAVAELRAGWELALSTALSRIERTLLERFPGRGAGVTVARVLEGPVRLELWTGPATIHGTRYLPGLYVVCRDRNGGLVAMEGRYVFRLSELGFAQRVDVAGSVPELVAELFKPRVRTENQDQAQALVRAASDAAAIGALAQTLNALNQVTVAIRPQVQDEDV